MVKKQIRLALIQMKIKGGNREYNLRHALEMIDQAAANSAEVILLPEAMNLGWTDPSALFEAEPIPEGKTCQALIRQAIEKCLYICFGLIERHRDTVYNSAVIISPKGEVILKHRKINELDIGQQFYSTGDVLDVCKTEFGIFGLAICADAFIPAHFKLLGELGADVILSPCSWATPKEHNIIKEGYGDEWTDSYIPISKYFSLWIAACSNVGWITDGPWIGRKCIGNSMVVNPKGQIVLTGRHGVDEESILHIEIDQK